MKLGLVQRQTVRRARGALVRALEAMERDTQAVEDPSLHDTFQVVKLSTVAWKLAIAAHREGEAETDNEKRMRLLVVEDAARKTHVAAKDLARVMADAAGQKAA